MTNFKKPKLAIVPNSNSTETQVEQPDKITSPQNNEQTNPIHKSGGNISYHSNPIYEKLLKFREQEKKKRFTVEDLLKW